MGFESPAAKFYNSIATAPNAGSLWAGMFKRQVLKYFDNLEGLHVFSIHCLDESTISE